VQYQSQVVCVYLDTEKKTVMCVYHVLLESSNLGLETGHAQHVNPGNIKRILAQDHATEIALSTVFHSQVQILPRIACVGQATRYPTITRAPCALQESTKKNLETANVIRVRNTVVPT